MKKLYIFLTFLAFHFSFSQIVNIPDANLKALLLSFSPTNGGALDINNNSIKIDTNNDGEIQVSEAQQVNALMLQLNNTNITNLDGLNEFPMLKSLALYNPNFTSAVSNLSNFPSLEYLQINHGLVNSWNIQNNIALKTVKLQSVLANSISIQGPMVNDIEIVGSLMTIENIDVNNCPLLKKIKLHASKISSLNLSNMIFLEEIDIAMNLFLSNINLQGSNGLKTVSITNNALTSINVANSPLLTFLVCSNNQLQSATISGCTSLATINFENNLLTFLDLSNLTMVQNVTLSNNLLTQVNLQNNNALLFLNVTDNQLTNLSTNQIPNLISLRINNNQFSNLNFADMPLLASVYCNNNLFTNLDFLQNHNLHYLTCTHNPFLELLFIKNGIDNFAPQNFVNFSDNPNLQFICADDIEVDVVKNLLLSNGQNNTQVSSYCSFTPGGIFYTIQGNVKYDINNNGCDISDPAQPFQKFNITNGALTGSLIANASGNYSIPVQAGTHTITPVLENPTYFNVTPSSLIADFPTQTSPLTQNFCLTANGSHNDLEVLIIPATPAAPGFNAQYKIVYKNKGTGVQSGSVTFNYNDNVMNFSTSTIVPDSQSTGLLSWNFSNLNPFESREMTVTFVLNTPTATPPLNGGDVLHFTSLVTALTDETPADNTFTLNQTVENSYDPNDKTCLQGSSISQSQVGDYVHYLIRFENTGTANAQNVVVKDVIDTNKFDINTLIALNASHSFVTRITAPNTVEFIFENIQLPFDDATNDGYVAFKIKTKSTLNNGDSFSNTAGIYFDYNAPIITNTYVTNILTLSTSEVETADELRIYPNPVIDVLTFKTKEKVVKVEILDISGRLLRSEGVQHNSLNVSDLKSGNYFIRIYLKNSTITRKMTKK